MSCTVAAALERTALLAVEAAVVGVEAAVERSRGRCRRERHDFEKYQISGGCHVGEERVQQFTIHD